MIGAPVALWAVTLFLALASFAYTAFALVRLGALRFPEPPEQQLPSVDVLKPVDGTEPELEENLRTFCEQEYPRYRMIVCAQSADDPALAVARRLRPQRGDCEIVVATGGGAPLPNPKIVNLEAAMPYANGEIFAFSDSDMCVAPDYLRRVAAAFADPRTGAATTLYGARSTGSYVARLGALFVNDQFAPSVLVATAMAPLRYCFGATMAVRARVLAEIGGLAAIGSTIADDYMLGRLVTQHGHRVALAGTIPLTLVSERTLRDLLAREVRWARTIRSMQPLGYAGTIVQFPILLALLNFTVAPSVLGSALLLAACVVARVALHLRAHAALGIPGSPAPWLVPARELLSAAVWFGGFLGPRVRWRQGNFSVRAKGC